MTPAQLSAIHAAAFEGSRGWNAAEFATLLDNPHCTLLDEPDDGFALCRTIAGETELLTIAVRPAAQGKGIGRALMHLWAKHASACDAFLEVAGDNKSAIGLYISCGFAEVARRVGYYARSNGPSVDAIVMRRSFP